MEKVIAHAMGLGLHVKYADLGRRSGELRSSDLVVINYRRPLWVQRTTLAHECGHWCHGHDWTNAHDVERDERQADLYAARLLVSEAEYQKAERLVGPHPGALAVELGVTRRMVELLQAGDGERWRLRSVAG